MSDFYASYYRAVETSAAHAAFCERAYGQNLCQHGFMDMEQQSVLLEVAGLCAGCRVLDVGCGNGRIAAFIAGATGARVVGIDASGEAIRRAQSIAQPRLAFVLADLRRPGFRSCSFDVLLSIDSLYFSDDYLDTLAQWRRLVVRGGRMLIFYSYGVDPENPEETFRVETLPADQTPLGQALRTLGYAFSTRDFTAADQALAERKLVALEALRAEFAAEGRQFLYDQRLAETRGVKHAAEIGMHARYLYDVCCEDSS